MPRPSKATPVRTPVKVSSRSKLPDDFEEEFSSISQDQRVLDGASLCRRRVTQNLSVICAKYDREYRDDETDIIDLDRLEIISNKGFVENLPDRHKVIGDTLAIADPIDPTFSEPSDDYTGHEEPSDGEDVDDDDDDEDEDEEDEFESDSSESDYDDTVIEKESYGGATNLDFLVPVGKKPSVGLDSHSENYFKALLSSKEKLMVDSARKSLFEYGKLSLPTSPKKGIKSELFSLPSTPRKTIMLEQSRSSHVKFDAKSPSVELETESPQSPIKSETKSKTEAKMDSVANMMEKYAKFTPVKREVHSKTTCKKSFCMDCAKAVIRA